MQTLSIKVSGELLSYYGKQALEESLQKMLALKSLAIKANTIHQALDEANLEENSFFEEARELAWEKHKESVRHKINPKK